MYQFYIFYQQWQMHSLTLGSSQTENAAKNQRISELEFRFSPTSAPAVYNVQCAPPKKCFHATQPRDVPSISRVQFCESHNIQANKFPLETKST